MSKKLFTTKEMKLISLIMEGCMTKEVAKDLNMNSKSVSYSKLRLKKKLDVVDKNDYALVEAFVNIYKALPEAVQESYNEVIPKLRKEPQSN